MTRRLVLAAFALAVVDAIFLSPALFSSEVRAPADVALHWPPFRVELPAPPPQAHNELLNDWLAQFHPWQHLVRDAWLAGRAPLWNDKAGCGEPLLANVQCEALSPYLPLLLATGDQYVDWRQFAQILVAQIFCLLLAAELSLSTAAGIVMALAYAFSSYMQIWAIHPHAASASFVPGMLWALLRLRHRASVGRIAVAGLCVAGSILAGHPETAAKGILVASSVTLLAVALRTPGVGRLRCGAAVTVGVAVGPLLAAVLLLPFLEYLGLSDVRSSRTTAGAPTLPLRQLATLFDPQVLGRAVNPVTYAGVGNYPDAVLHVGVAALVLAACGAALGIVRRPAIVLPLLLVAAAGVAVASAITPDDAVWRSIPIVRDLWPHRMLSAAVLPLAVLAGLGFDLAARALRAFSRPARIACGAAVLALVAWTSAAPWRDFLVAHPVARLHPPSRILDELRSRAVSGRVLPLARTLAAGHGELYGFRSMLRFDAVGLARVNALFREDVNAFPIFNYDGVTFAPPALLDVASVRWVLSTYPAADARTPLPPLWVGPGAAIDIPLPPAAREAGELELVVFRWKQEILRDGTIEIAVRRGDAETRYVLDPAGWTASGGPQPAATIVPPVAELFEAQLRPFAKEILTVPRAVAKGAERIEFHAHGARGFLATALSPSGLGASIRPSAAVDWVRIDERTSAMPDAYLTPAVFPAASVEDAAARVRDRTFDPREATILESGAAPASGAAAPLEPGETAVILDCAPGRTSMDVTAARDRWLVVTETFMPGWRATVDGRDVPVVPANVLARACPVPAGRHRVVMRYAPPSFVGGAAVSLTTLVILAGLSIRQRRRYVPDDTTRMKQSR